MEKAHLYIGRISPTETIELKTTIFVKILRFININLCLDTKTLTNLEFFLKETNFYNIKSAILANNCFKIKIGLLYEEKKDFLDSLSYFCNNRSVDFINFNDQEQLREIEWIFDKQVNNKKFIEIRHNYFLAKSTYQIYSMLSMVKAAKYLLTK